MTQLKGHIERITFSNEQNAFCVCRLKVKGERQLITVVGNMVNPLPGEFVELKGKWITHSKFGNQFQVQHYKTLVPATQSGIQKYLGSGLIKGIGPVMAKRIVKMFGVNALEIIEKDIWQLLKIPGIGKKRVEMIKKAWEDQKEVRTVMLFLQSHGVSATYAAKIFKTYGQDAIAIVKENPYRLARDIFGIGFLTADQIAENIGIGPQSPERIQAGLEYMLNQLAAEGHLCYPYRTLCEKTCEMLEVENDLVVQGVADAFQAGRIVIENIHAADEFEQNNKMVFLKQFHVCETGITNRLTHLLKSPSDFRPIDAEKAFSWVNTQIKLTFAPLQKEAIKRAADQKILVITGGPGTGKTTIINAIITIYKKAGARMMLAAPTGRAAKRMRETTRENARTIHRLLDYSMQIFGFKKNDKNPLKCDLLIIDEASMIDTVLMHHLLKAVPNGAVLILVGDVHQLPSVGPGNVLGDIIDSGCFPVVRLETIFRQARKSLIVVNAHRINKGEFPILPGEDKQSNFYFIQKEAPENVMETIVDLVKNRIPRRFSYVASDDIQVLTPMHRGLIGAGNLNTVLQDALNPDQSGLKRGSSEFRAGDKVMQIRNNYDKNTYNGDIGRINKIDFSDQVVTIDFDGRYVEYDFSSLDEITLAYAVSIHKSQGSEYPVVVIPVVTQHYILLQRNLIYTAVTRGKKLVVMVGTKKALGMAISTIKASKRFTRLKERLDEKSKKKA